MNLTLGHFTCADEAAAGREWLVTNGIGGFASGTVSDILTRRYHGLLFAALAPPLGRTLLFTKVDATVSYGGRDYRLGANRWADGTIDPNGFIHIDSFTLDGTTPTWTYAFSDVLLERSVWMERGRNLTYIRYAVRRSSAPLTLALRAFVNARDYHAVTRAYERPAGVAIEGRVARVRMNADAPELLLQADRGVFSPGAGWYYGFRLAAETERGLEDLEDHVHAVTLDVVLGPGETIDLAASNEPFELEAATSLHRRVTSDAAIRDRRRETAAAADGAPAWVEQLVLAADQFVAERKTAAGAGTTIVAGYPWFGDWGRDTMIALPGIALVTGRFDVARDVLRTFARFVDQGMLPNRFPDAGEAPEYNTVDATLWFVEAIRQYVETTADVALLEEVFPVLEQIVSWHCRGTRYGIHVDERDGLLHSGEAGVQLTWMDAKVGDRVITPRTGKAIEINALWHNALLATHRFAERLGKAGAEYAALAKRACESFERF